MRHALRGAALLLLVMLVLPGSAREKKDAKKDKDLDSPKKDLIKVGSLVGTIVTLDESKKTLRLRFDSSKTTLNPNSVQGLAQARVNLQQAQARAPNDTGKPAAIQSTLQQIAQYQRDMYTTSKTSEEVEWGTTDDFIVRLANPPPQFDEKGKVKKYTKKELDDLRGENKKLPGFKGDFSDLRSNMIVKVDVMRPKVIARPKPNPKSKEADADLIADNKPQISMIMVLGEPKQP